MLLCVHWMFVVCQHVSKQLHEPTVYQGCVSVHLIFLESLNSYSWTFSEISVIASDAVDVTDMTLHDRIMNSLKTVKKCGFKMTFFSEISKCTLPFSVHFPII